MKKLLLLIFTFLIMFTQSFAFSDNYNFYWANKAVNKWNSKGYISGYPDGTFRGNNNITRAEVISIINKLNNSDTEVIKRVSKDITPSDWYFYDMCKAKEDGLIELDSDGNLRSEEYATREDAMVILSKLLDISYSGNLDRAKVKSYTDNNDIKPENYKRVAGIIEEGYVTGYSDNTLKPNKEITRAEFISMIDNAIDEVYTNGTYNNKVIKGNVLINGDNVELVNSEVSGKVFVVDGAKNSHPSLINTRVSKGINSRVGNILTQEKDDFKTVSQYKDEVKETVKEPVIAKLTYSEEGWTNNDVKVKIKLDNKNYELIDGESTIKFKENGEKEVEFEYNGDRVKVKAKVNNIDKQKPKIIASSQMQGNSAIITVEVKDDGLSPIESISLNNTINTVDSETGVIENTFTVTKNGTYNIYVEDEAGNIGKTAIKITDIIESSVEPEIPNQPDLPVEPEIPLEPERPEDPTAKPLPNNGYILQAPDGTGGIGNGIVVDKTLTFTGTLPYYTSSISDRRGNWIGAKVTAPSNLELKNTKIYVDNVLTDIIVSEVDNSFLYYEEAVIGKTTKLTVLWNEEYKSETFYIIVSKDAKLQTSELKMLIIDPNTGKWNNSSEIQTLNGEVNEKIKIIDPIKNGFILTLAGNSGNVIGETSIKINKFLNWELDGEGKFENGYYTFGNGEGRITARYLTEIKLPEVEKEGYVLTGWFTEAAGGEKIGDGGDIYIPTEEKTLYAQFTEGLFKLEVKTSPNAGGKVLGVNDYYYGENVELVAEPISGYYFKNWTIDGISVEPNALNENKLNFIMPAKKVTITANFVPYVIVTSISGENGSIIRRGGTIDGEVYTVLGGVDIVYEMIPDSGYQVKDVIVDNVSVGAVTSYTFYNIMVDHSIEVEFETKKIYGIRKHVNYYANEWERIENSTGLIAEATKDGLESRNNFDNIYPWSNIQSYNYDTEKNKITAWHGDDNFRFDGSNGEVLTLIPEFYYRHVIEDNYEYYYITRFETEGYIKSEEFSVGRYLMSESNSKGHSYSKTFPITNKTITEHRELAKSLGEGFGQMDYRYFAIQMLYLVEYANYDSQKTLGVGITEITGNEYKAKMSETKTNRIIIDAGMEVKVNEAITIIDKNNNFSKARNRVIKSIEEYSDNDISGIAITFEGASIDINVDDLVSGQPQKLGSCDSLGMRSGTLINDGKHSVIYRGIEDFFGNTFVWIDGLKLSGGEIYVCYKPEIYMENIMNEEYKNLNFKYQENYDQTITSVNFDNMHSIVTLPAKNNGTKALIDDYSVMSGGGGNIEVQDVRVGGSYKSKAQAGSWCFMGGYNTNWFSREAGARILKYE